MERLLTVDEAAEYLGRSPQWLAAAARNGDVPSRKIGRYRRFTESDLMAYLESVRDGGLSSGRVTRKRGAA
jgi:excisionase family DNA binding protein